MWSRLVYLDGGSGIPLEQINNTPHPYCEEHWLLLQIQYRVTSVLLSLFRWNFPDFHPRIKANTLSSKIICLCCYFTISAIQSYTKNIFHQNFPNFFTPHPKLLSSPTSRCKVRHSPTLSLLPPRNAGSFFSTHTTKRLFSILNLELHKYVIPRLALSKAMGIYLILYIYPFTKTSSPIVFCPPNLNFILKIFWYYASKSYICTHKCLLRIMFKANFSYQYFFFYRSCGQDVVCR